MEEEQPSQTEQHKQSSMFGNMFGQKNEQQAQPQQSLGGLFGQKKSGSDASKDMAHLSTLVNDLSRRLIVLEERYNDLRRTSQVTEQNMISDFKKLHNELKTTNSDMIDMKKDMQDVKGKILLIIKELKMTARKEDTDVIQKYLQLWEPIKFVTQNEVEKLVQDVVEEKFADLNLKLEEEGFIDQEVRKAVERVVNKVVKKGK